VAAHQRHRRGRVRHTIAKAVHRFFDQNGFVWINTPIIDLRCRGRATLPASTLDLSNLPRTAQGGSTSAPTSSGAGPLTVSGQLNIETYCTLSKVYTFGPTFHAENSNTSRHWRSSG
jgi:asparaginyl-tRNA synthetase